MAANEESAAPLFAVKLAKSNACCELASLGSEHATAAASALHATFTVASHCPCNTLLHSILLFSFYFIVVFFLFLHFSSLFCAFLVTSANRVLLCGV